MTGGSLAIRGGYRAARNGAIGCAVLLAVIEGVGIGFQKMMAGSTKLEVSRHVFGSVSPFCSILTTVFTRLRCHHRAMRGLWLEQLDTANGIDAATALLETRQLSRTTCIWDGAIVSWCFCILYEFGPRYILPIWAHCCHHCNITQLPHFGSFLCLLFDCTCSMFLSLANDISNRT